MYCSVTYCSSMEVWSIEGSVSGSRPVVNQVLCLAYVYIWQVSQGVTWFAW